MYVRGRIALLPDALCNGSGVFFFLFVFFFTDPHNVCTQLAFIGSVPALKDVALLPLCPLIMDRAESE